MSITAYSTYQQTRGFSRATVRRRRASLASLAAHAAPAPLTAVTRDLVEDWLSGFAGPATRRAYLLDVRSYFRWATKRGVAVDDPTDGLDPPRVPRAMPRPAPAGLVPGLVAAAPDDDLALMVALAAYAGLRRAEIAALDWADLDVWRDPPALMVRAGKGGKDRRVPVHPELGRLLRARRPGVGRVLGVSAGHVGARVSAHLHACGLDATCHQLRHTFATELARASGGNVLLVGSLLGHSDPATTMVYVAWADTGWDAVGGMYAA